MKKSLLIIFVLILFHYCGFAQTQGLTRLDSLHKALASAMPDSKKIDLLLDISAEYILSDNDYEKSVDFAGRALELAVKKNNKDKLIKSLKAIKAAYDSKINYICKEDNLKLLADAKARDQEERIEEIERVKARANEEKLVAITKVHQQNQQSIIYFILFILLIVSTAALFIYFRYKITAKQQRIIKNQKKIVEEKNKEITQSLEYALRIQSSILPSQRVINEYLPDSFILYKPKHIVSGDFYWIDTVGDITLFAACDCTGHGVPGAMVSVVCFIALNRSVSVFGLTNPAEILDKTAETVIAHFSKSEQDLKDGMDISLCAYNSKTKTLSWAGAHNPLWLVHNNELIETRADRQPIGKNGIRHPFTNHEFVLAGGDTIYLFTDGYADQFGGPTGQKKLTSKRFKDLILSMNAKPMPEQGNVLDKFITEYHRETEQIDDILVMGIKV